MTRVAIVTGGTRGIGRAICERLRDEREFTVIANYAGNDDAARAVRLYCDAFGEAARRDGASDPGVGEMENPPAEAAEATA